MLAKHKSDTPGALSRKLLSAEAVAIMEESKRRFVETIKREKKRHRDHGFKQQRDRFK